MAALSSAQISIVPSKKFYYGFTMEPREGAAMNERLGHEDVSTLQREGGKRTGVVVQRASIVASGEPKTHW